MPPAFLLSSCPNRTLSSADLVTHSVLYAFHSFPLPGGEEVEHRSTFMLLLNIKSQEVIKT